ncbi:ABC transporter G family member 3 [Camellia lanceoleosa]|uniref:ABC transporter G family member 3 n=1 Tax=Camellia lanceoleosa TaxID=1840588 RepID=A0ACC0G2N6_9ERIC|nr:ABC transporter G family member 3 [Camellia lanceoleosa]
MKTILQDQKWRSQRRWVRTPKSSWCGFALELGPSKALCTRRCLNLLYYNDIVIVCWAELVENEVKVRDWTEVDSELLSVRAGDLWVGALMISFVRFIEDNQGDFSSVNVDTAIAIRTLEATYKSSADATAVETMILKLTEKEASSLKSKGKASIATRIAVLTWRSLLIMSREWKYYSLWLILYMLLLRSDSTNFYGLGHSLSSVMVSFMNLKSNTFRSLQNVG